MNQPRYKIVFDGQLMPEGGPLIPLSERNLIRDWILQGAQDN